MITSLRNLRRRHSVQSCSAATTGFTKSATIFGNPRVARGALPEAPSQRACAFVVWHGAVCSHRRVRTYISDCCASLAGTHITDTLEIMFGRCPQQWPWRHCRAVPLRPLRPPATSAGAAGARRAEERLQTSRRYQTNFKGAPKRRSGPWSTKDKTSGCVAAA